MRSTSNPHVYKVGYDALKDFDAGHPAVAAADRAGGASEARREYDGRTGRAGEAASPACATRPAAASARHSTWSTQWFAQLAGIELEQVPYRGGGQAINDLIAGHVKLGTLGSTPLIPHYKAGTLRLLAQTTAARSPSLPDVPTFQEAGIRARARPMARRVRAGRHAAGDRRAAQCRDRQSAGEPAISRI